ncbi:MAG: hypothetical protein ABIO44_04525 [Saprospiraceae bacterium]
MMFRLIAIIIKISFLSLVFLQCKNDGKVGSQEDKAVESNVKKEVFIVSLDGTPLSKWKDPDSVWIKRNKELERCRAAYLAKTEDPISYLRYARAYSEAAKIENAIDILTKGIEKFPEVADLYVYRGENMLLGRQLTESVDNFWKAGQKLEKSSGSHGLLQMEEEDSIANMSLAYKNYFNMALAFFCNNDLSSADKFFEVCGDFSTNSDLWIRSYYWQYSCYSRSGRTTDAKDILKNLNDKMQILPISKSYLEAMKYYKGSIKESDFVDVNFKPTNSIEAEPWLIKTYAVGVKSLLENNKDKALNTFIKIKESGFWKNPFCLAAEAELMHLSGKTYQEPEKIELSSKQRKK